MSFKPARLDIDSYVMLLACIARLRSEDPYLKVGAVALSEDNRVIGTAYNGLAPGVNKPPSFWADRAARLPFLIHAEINLCSLFERGAAHTVAATTMPCPSCAAVLIAHKVKRVLWGSRYHRDAGNQSEMLFEDAGITLFHVPVDRVAGQLYACCFEPAVMTKRSWAWATMQVLRKILS